MVGGVFWGFDDFEVVEEFFIVFDLIEFDGGEMGFGVGDEVLFVGVW